MVDYSLAAAASTPLQVAGAWLLLADMILCAVLFAFWEKAARVRVRIGRRQP